MTYTIRDAVFPDEYAAVHSLLTQYQAEVAIDLCFQEFAAELHGLPGSYAAPSGLLLCAATAKSLVGCIALRALQDDTAEMKRLYIEPAHRGAGIARQLVAALICRARQLRYQRIVLDTLPTMVSAQQLYSSLGFIDTAPYTYNPVAGARYMQLSLGQLI